MTWLTAFFRSDGSECFSAFLRAACASPGIGGMMLSAGPEGDKESGSSISSILGRAVSPELNTLITGAR